MEERASERLVDQRIRTRIAYVMEGLSEGMSYAEQLGEAEWVNSFFDWFPFDNWKPLDNSSMTPDELEAVEEVRAMMVKATAESDSLAPSEKLRGTTWPDYIRPHATKLYQAMKQRGRFSDDFEEDEPSCSFD